MKIRYLEKKMKIRYLEIFVCKFPHSRGEIWIPIDISAIYVGEQNVYSVA